jgi:hypothetical protein
LPKRGIVRAQRGNKVRPFGSAWFAGQRPCVAEKHFAVLTFGSFCQEKEHLFAINGCFYLNSRSVYYSS